MYSASHDGLPSQSQHHRKLTGHIQAAAAISPKQRCCERKQHICCWLDASLTEIRAPEFSYSECSTRPGGDQLQSGMPMPFSKNKFFPFCVEICKLYRVRLFLCGIMMVVFALVLLLASSFGLTWAVVALHKDTMLRGKLMVRKHSSDPIQLGNSEFMVTDSGALVARSSPVSAAGAPVLGTYGLYLTRTINANMTTRLLNTLTRVHVRRDPPEQPELLTGFWIRKSDPDAGWGPSSGKLHREPAARGMADSLGASRTVWLLLVAAIMVLVVVVVVVVVVGDISSGAPGGVNGSNGGQVGFRVTGFAVLEPPGTPPELHISTPTGVLVLVGDKLSSYSAAAGLLDTDELQGQTTNTNAGTDLRSGGAVLWQAAFPCTSELASDEARALRTWLCNCLMLRQLYGRTIGTRFRMPVSLSAQLVCGSCGECPNSTNLLLLLLLLPANRGSSPTTHRMKCRIHERFVTFFWPVIVVPHKRYREITPCSPPPAPRRACRTC
ncbi:hypothetical protein VOLCADRAFT_86960 [Volvox carteri f. nagariensis]|uniref:Uncharacterized protein n=1 Tax=Volvox carteri f. nagariensis TaxID=3068 RepID=D8TKU2_VOLCA|nr:uncharacterized protein VOLCADRAFT_86960 [Volvox carteri f. nagariensis]EFJ51943.1 hypothetical protein VOLCADRAFT_86960 [Volvox carteri f. nagariensis]|eukprot:XP_002946717.1 hypothetical protein VOLCADRAFT_86960 [Volvox carteri f. nagariensis]